MTGKNLAVPSFPSTNSPQRIMAESSPARNKVALKPGHSLMDWIRLGRSGQDLTGVNGQVLEVTEEELAKHNKQDDGWLALRGKVYNVSPYMEYHPGGIDELKRGLGKDATQLFDEIHKWVNAESMLEKCYVGKLSTPVVRKSSTSSGKLSANGTISLINLKPPEPTGPIPPKDNELEAEVTSDYNVKVQKDTGKTEICVPKVQVDRQWTSLGKPLDKHCIYKKTTDIEVHYRNCNIVSISSVNYDTKLLGVELPEGCRMCVPVGYHIHIHHNISGMDIVRSYTCVQPSLTEDIPKSSEKYGRLVYLMIKMYPDGTLTSWLNKLNIGDTLKMSNFDGKFNASCLATTHQLVLYAAGSGFTPMIRLLYHSLQNQSTIKSVKLLFFNKRQKDILWRNQLDQLSAQSNKRFEITYILSEADDTWTGYIGRIRAEFIEKFIPSKDKQEKILVCACGPTSFTKEVMRLAKEHGCEENELHAFLG